MKNKYKDLETLLRCHDWSLLMSDDFRKQSVAHQQSLLIHAEMRRLGNTKKVRQMYEDAKPDYLKKSSFIDSGSQHLSTPGEDDNWDEKFIWKIK